MPSASDTEAGPTKCVLPDFVLPDGLEATEPPPSRDGVRLLVASPGSLAHTRFSRLGEYLAPGDLVVVNTSATLAAAVDGKRAGAIDQ